MSIDRRKGLEDDRLKVAIAYGLGFTNPEAAEFGGVSESTAKRWKTDDLTRWVSNAVAAGLSIYKSRQVKNAVDEAVESAEDRIGRLFDRSLRFAERILQKAESKGDEIEIEEAKYIYENIAKWAAKYKVSEAPKRMEFEGKQTHTHVHVLSLAEAGNIWERRKQIESVGRPLIAGESNVIDVTPDA